MVSRRRVVAVAVLVFVVDPGLACSGDPEFEFGAPEMRAAVEGSWRVQGDGWTARLFATIAPDATGPVPASLLGPPATTVSLERLSP
jgi:hypothetical protein